MCIRDRYQRRVHGDISRRKVMKITFVLVFVALSLLAVSMVNATFVPGTCVSPCRYLPTCVRHNQRESCRSHCTCPVKKSINLDENQKWVNKYCYDQRICATGNFGCHYRRVCI
eukprot:TRINITY_DN12_c0_g1_i1.p1 TRINITY_DN12_c0_g1~~TRINITY_DN12_c0_g1_i1.p1  ORF type:complete len:114 (+),score=24.34 TRINITY_DN12_c0_g1_i1:83-424(+)